MRCKQCLRLSFYRSFAHFAPWTPYEISWCAHDFFKYSIQFIRWKVCCFVHLNVYSQLNRHYERERWRHEYNQRIPQFFSLSHSLSKKPPATKIHHLEMRQSEWDAHTQRQQKNTTTYENSIANGYFIPNVFIVFSNLGEYESNGSKTHQKNSKSKTNLPNQDGAEKKQTTTKPSNRLWLRQ